MKPLAQTLLALASAVALVAGSARNAHATPVEIQTAVGTNTFASTWRHDFGLGGELRLGVRFAHVFAIDFVGWEAIGGIDRRMNTGLSFGLAGYIPLRPVHPYARLFVIHQHEEGLVSVENAPAGVVLGIGSGIRHRAGAGFNLGAEIPFKRAANGKLTWVFLANATAIWFPDVLGPNGYFGLDFGAGFDFLL